MEYWAHETAIIDKGAKIGGNTKVWHWTHICGGAEIGQSCSFGQNVFVGNKVKIGNQVKVQNNVSIYDEVEIEDDVFCGPSMVFTNVINPRSHISRKDEYKKSIVKKGASIGANATIICGNDIGQFAFIAAGAVITKPVPDYALMAGVPAKQMAWMCNCGNRLAVEVDCESDSVQCSHCDSKFQIHDRICRKL